MKTLALLIFALFSSDALLAADKQTIAPDTAVDTLRFFVGEVVEVTVQDGRVVKGELRGVTTTAAVLVAADGTVVSLRPADIIALLRVPAGALASSNVPAGPPSNFSWVQLSATLFGSRQLDRSVLLFVPSIVLDPNCRYMIELGPTAAGLSVAPTTPPSLLLPPDVAIDPKIVTSARISGCAVNIALTPAEIGNLSRLNWHSSTADRRPNAENDGVRSVHSPASRAQVPTAYAEVNAGAVSDEIATLREDFGFDWKAWLIFGLAGTAATTATSYLAFSTPIESRDRPVIIAAGGVTSSVLALTSGIFGLKAIYEYIEVSKLEVAADRR